MTAERQAALEAKQEHTHKLVEEMHEHILGAPGTDGLVTRVAKVEQRQAFNSKIIWTGFLSILGMIVAFFKTKL